MKNIFLKLLARLTLFFALTYNMLQAQTFEWAKQYGGTGDEVSRSVATDIVGNVYITGYSDSAYYDFFISKLDSNGNFIWTKSIGGPYLDQALNITIDSYFNLYISGNFSDSVDFDPSINVTQLTSTGLKDAFLLKLDSAGNFIWVKQFGGLSDDNGISTSIDNSNAIYFSGIFWDTVYVNTTSGLTHITSSGLGDVFVSKLDSAGNILWVKSIGGTQSDEVYSTTMDSNSNVLILGRFISVCDFNPDSMVTNNLLSFGQADVFVCKWDTAGNFVWVKQLGGSNYEAGLDIITDAVNDIYIIGSFLDTIDVDPSTLVYSLYSKGNYDVYIAKLDNNGNLIWAKSWGGSGIDFGFSLDNDGVGNIYTTGGFSDTVDFDSGSGIPPLIASSNRSTFISKINSSGNLLWVKQLESSSVSTGIKISLDDNENIYITGVFSDTCDFNPSNQVFNLIAVDGNDGFIVKWSQTGTAIVELADKTDFMVFPNPFSDKLFLRINQPSLISIKNTMGQMAYERKLPDGVNAIDLSALQNGAYFIGVQSSNKYLSKTIIKTN
ncbi:MAG TPA: SBBP repeat-containing protein [Bacteroidia bacterium]|nr:SBBP repeat-containing protein [Bacteroidia bacterium]HNU32604.1 SBBP repeat-containing protein [Bacteroidia bacterium]